MIYTEMETSKTTIDLDTMTDNWLKVCKAGDVPENGGACVLYNGEQIAIYNFSRRGEWFATQNLCPHKKQMILSRGMLGDEKGTPKVACPFHKKTFSLQSGDCLNAEEESIKVYNVKEDGGDIYLDTSNLA